MKHFNLKQFKCKCKELPADAWMYVDKLVDNILDPVADKFMKPIKVLSGYRCEKHCTKVGGPSQMVGQHTCGQAAAVCAETEGYANMSDWKQANMEIARLILKCGRFDYLILEGVGEQDLMPATVHVSYNPRLNHGIVMKKVVGQVGYKELTTEEIASLLGSGFRVQDSSSRFGAARRICD
jgi:hypothetical protein